jgi:hypothetical protein
MPERNRNQKCRNRNGQGQTLKVPGSSSRVPCFLFFFRVLHASPCSFHWLCGEFPNQWTRFPSNAEPIVYPSGWVDVRKDLVSVLLLPVGDPMAASMDPGPSAGIDTVLGSSTHCHSQRNLEPQACHHVIMDELPALSALASCGSCLLDSSTSSSGLLPCDSGSWSTAETGQRAP